MSGLVNELLPLMLYELDMDEGCEEWDTRESAWKNINKKGEVDSLSAQLQGCSLLLSIVGE